MVTRLATLLLIGGLFLWAPVALAATLMLKSPLGLVEMMK